MVSEWLIIIAVFVGAAGIIYFGFRGIRRRELAEIERFKQFETTEDDDFLDSLGLSKGTPDAQNAIALRAGIAELGEVPPSSIRAEHCFYPDLERLPFYDSIDLLGLILTAEVKAGMKLGESCNEELGKAVADGTVGDFILAVLQCRPGEQQ